MFGEFFGALLGAGEDGGDFRVGHEAAIGLQVNVADEAGSKQRYFGFFHDFQYASRDLARTIPDMMQVA
jgi:hypothetical protein